MTRRRFAFWIGMLLFWLSKKLHAEAIDSAAASLMTWTESPKRDSSRRDRWRPSENRDWSWFERQTRIDGQWKLSGRTTPIHKTKGTPYTGQTGYLDEKLVPESIRDRRSLLRKKLAAAKVDSTRRAEGGKPPSKWLRSLNADEIRVWLKTINVPEFGVEGMTFWTHLTRDHHFTAERIHGLSVAEQGKLHSAAHYGY